MLNPSQLHSTYIWKQPSLTGGTTPSYPCLPTSSRDFCLLWSSLMTTEIFFLKLALWAYNSSKRLFVLFLFYVHDALSLIFNSKNVYIYFFFRHLWFMPLECRWWMRRAGLHPQCKLPTSWASCLSWDYAFLFAFSLQQCKLVSLP